MRAVWLRWYGKGRPVTTFCQLAGKDLFPRPVHKVMVNQSDCGIRNAIVCLKLFDTRYYYKQIQGLVLLTLWKGIFICFGAFSISDRVRTQV